MQADKQVDDLVEVYILNELGDYYLTHAIPENEVVDTKRYTTIEPPEHKDGMARIFDRSKKEWSYSKDFRGTAAYSIKTGSPVVVDYLGDLKKAYTFITPDVVDVSAGQ